jgi:hypothetical protein
MAVDELNSDAIDAAVRDIYGQKGKSTAKAKTFDLTGLSPDLADRLQKAQEAYRREYGKDLPVTSAVRSTEEQKKLYEQRAKNPNLVAPPGSSLHETGNALDIAANVPEDFLNKFGIHRPLGKKDPVHAVAMKDFQGDVMDVKDIESVVGDIYKGQTPAKPRDAKGNIPYMPPTQQEPSTIAKLGRSAAGLADTVIGNIQALPGTALAEVGYAGVRALEGLGLAEPGRAERGREAVYKEFVEPYMQPVGKTTGVAQTPEYKGEASQQLMQFIGENLDKGADWISQKTGLPKADVQNIINTGMVAAGPAAGRFAGKVVNKAVTAAENIVPKAAQAVTAVKEAVQNVVPTEAGATMKQQFERKKMGYGTETTQGQALSGVGAARTEANPYAGSITGEEPTGPFPSVKLSKIRNDVPAAEQNVRAQILSEVLGKDASGIREGVLKGNEDILRNEYTLAKKADTPAAQILKQQLADEQNALSNYSQERINNTGANRHFDSDYSRGQAINDAFAGDEGIKGWFKKQKNDLYEEAKNKVGDNPITTSNVDDLLANKQFRAGLGLKNNEGVAKSAQDLIELAKTVGFEDDVGKFHPANSISGWDAVRKSLNSNWTKDNASVIRKINEAIDKDVAAAGGGDLYKAADRMHKAEKVLFSSKGIKNMFGEIDPNGVSTGTASEAIPKKLNEIKFDEWRHIYDMADQISKGSVKINGEMVAVPEEVIAAARAAKNEIKGALARDIYKAGAGNKGEWSAVKARDRMNALDQKIRHAFDPEEVQAFHKLNYAGQLMPTHGYEGAALQTSRLERFAEKLPAAGAAAGAYVGGPIGAVGGEAIGGKTSGFFKGRSQRQAAERLQKQLEENFRKGRQ